MKAFYNTATEIPEPLKGEYEEKNGKWILKLEGAQPDPQIAELNGKLDEFRNNNRSLNTLKTELETKLKTYEGVDPVEYGKMKTRIAELEKRGVKGSDDLTSMLKDAVNSAVKPLEEKLAAREAAEKAAVERANRESLRSELTTAGTKVGIDDRAMTDYLNRGLTVFSIEDGKKVAKKSDGTPMFSKKDPSELLSIEEWAETLENDAPHLFRPSRGGGATGGDGRPAAREVKRQISSDPLTFGKNLEAIAKGEVQVVD